MCRSVRMDNSTFGATMRVLTFSSPVYSSKTRYKGVQRNSVCRGDGGISEGAPAVCPGRPI
jgi:hypothetical protein